jgi:hypothetical protein
MNGVEWKLVDMIKKGVITFQKGDVVKVFRRKVNGYPRGLKDDEEYFVRNIDSDSLFVAQHSSDGIGWLSPIRVHKTYMMNKTTLRDIKLNSILGETNLINLI